jgi:hypothetical protein
MAKRRPSAEDLLHASVLGDRLLLVVRFIEGVESFPIGPQMRTVIEDAMKRGDTRALKLVSRDVTEMTHALSSEHQSELARVLYETLGVNLQEEENVVTKAVKATLLRGCIQSERERQRLERYVEWLEQVGGDPQEIAAVTELLRAD